VGTSLTAADVKNMLKSTAQAWGPENDWGSGLLDGYAFVAEVLNEAISEANPFPNYQPISGTVSDNGEWTWTFEIAEDDLDIPIGITITTDGIRACAFEFGSFGCLAWYWSPDLDAQLFDPYNNK
jgi:serine protease AprX